jgi:hypothetical protein
MLGIKLNLSKSQLRLLLLLLPVVGLLAVGGLIYVFPTASNQYYAPEQPIPFSHKIHAGQNKMDCRYCHASAWKSAHASVPSMNVCMNCHRVVKTDSPHIQKLTKAYEEGKPIQWVRVHELPDHARFNHKAHVLKGVSCQTCHGDIAAMDKVYQHAPLTMGWCLNCHRDQNAPSSVKRLVSEKDKEEYDGGNAPFQCVTCHY